MPRYYCDYCDTYLTHDSEAQLNQSLIDQKVKEHLGAFRPHFAPYPQMRLGIPILPTPMLIPGSQFPRFRPPIFLGPMPGAPGYMASQMPQMTPPPGARFLGKANGFQMPASAPPPPMVSGSAGMDTSGGPPMFSPSTYRASAFVPIGGGSNDSNTNAQAPRTSQ